MVNYSTIAHPIIEDPREWCDPVDQFDVIDWLTHSDEGKEHFMDAMFTNTDCFEELQAIMWSAEAVGRFRTIENRKMVGDVLSDFMTRWLNKIAEDDYEKIKERAELWKMAD